jgi:hypothetical protein
VAGRVDEEDVAAAQVCGTMSHFCDSPGETGAWGGLPGRWFRCACAIREKGPDDMAIRDKMSANAAPYLQPGETVQTVFGAQTHSQYLFMISGFVLLLVNSYRVVVVTDRRLLVCRSGRLSATAVNEVLRELPRSTRIGPPSGLWWKCESLGERLYVHKRFHKDIKVADGAPV